MFKHQNILVQNHRNHSQENVKSSHFLVNESDIKPQNTAAKRSQLLAREFPKMYMWTCYIFLFRAPAVLASAAHS